MQKFPFKQLAAQSSRRVPTEIYSEVFLYEQFLIPPSCPLPKAAAYLFIRPHMPLYADLVAPLSAGLEAIFCDGTS